MMGTLGRTRPSYWTSAGIEAVQASSACLAATSSKFPSNPGPRRGAREAPRGSKPAGSGLVLGGIGGAPQPGNQPAHRDGAGAAAGGGDSRVRGGWTIARRLAVNRHQGEGATPLR